MNPVWNEVWNGSSFNEDRNVFGKQSRFEKIYKRINSFEMDDLDLESMNHGLNGCSVG